MARLCSVLCKPREDVIDVIRLAARLIELLAQLIEQDQCADVVIIVDTLKKVVDLMDKKHAAALGDLVRRFVLKGGTFIALAHTRKNEGADGKLVYGGTSDIVEDFDAACLLVPLKERSANDEKLVQFQFRKRRGPNVDETYAYTDAAEASWSEKLASVRLVTDDEASEYGANDAGDTQIVAAIREAIGAGKVQKMALVREVAGKVKASRRTVMACLERYTGPDSIEHHWDFDVQERGAKVYRLLSG